MPFFRSPPGLVGALFGVLLLLSAGNATAQLNSEEIEALDARLTEMKRVGDPLEDKEREGIFILTVYNKTNFFIDDKGRYRGFEYDILKGYEKFLNKGRKGASSHYKVFFIPMLFEDILPALAAGRGDMAAANLTVTPERERVVDFVDAYLPNVSEIVVAHQDGPEINSVDDLSGRSVFVLAGTSYVTHLKAINERFKKEGRDSIEIVEADPEFDHADVFDLVNSGVVGLTIADDHIATVWAPMFPNIVLKPDVKISSGGKVAWAVRKGAPKLEESLNAYVRTIKKGTLTGNMAFNDYYKSRRWLKNPLEPAELNKLDPVLDHMKKYSEMFNRDWIAVAAQAYQESGLDQRKVSPAGAVGIMQLLPSTASQKPISVKNIKKVENNIHAGVKYLSFVRERYFSDPEIAPADRVDFSWAAYNAGPTRIQKLRRKAEKRGYDPNKWFNNVEHLASETIGRETVDYVININKYYVVYKFALERRERMLALREEQAREAERAKYEKALNAWRRSYVNRRP
jgi:membrane-bound lytic murein transglycosylase MltF